jgi:ATP-dependent RNA helicase RhlB
VFSNIVRKIRLTLFGPTAEKPVPPPKVESARVRQGPRPGERQGRPPGGARPGPRTGEKQEPRRGRREEPRTGERPERREGERQGGRPEQRRPPRPPRETPPRQKEEAVPKAPAQPWDPSTFRVPPEEGKIRFHDLEIPEQVMHAIADLNFRYCTPVQGKVLPYSLNGDDVAGQAQTGTGKTAAFLITILTHFLRQPPPEKRRTSTPRALVLAPTRELALQIENDARALSKYVPCNVVAVFGGMDFEKQKRLIENRDVDLVIATPGRLIDFQRRKVISLSAVEILIIDEADRMLDMGFIPDVRRIVESTPPKSKRQTMFFSATLTSDVRRLAVSWTRDAATIEIAPEHVAVDTIDQQVFITTTDEKFTLLHNMIVKQDLHRVLVFANRRDVSRRLSERLHSYGISTGLLSGDVEQAKRIKTLDAFKKGEYRVLVATDVAARGLHIEGISHVINYNLPMNAEDYVHRIGRTGRAGASGISVSFACEEDAPQVPVIEEFIGRKLKALYPEDAWLVALPAPVHALPKHHGDDRRGGKRGGGDRRHDGRGGGRGRRGGSRRS